ncbi:IS66 family transposase [Spirulina major]|uniref:IS66 family transposase n=1 Tax=Spirulina major TaxID=270636 RepID=UPI0009333789|nr:IS66 family transposase [Spirulina major]
MKPIEIPPAVEREQLRQASSEVLVELVLRQQEVIQQLVWEIERLKNNANSDSESSSKPPSSDIHKRSEHQPPEKEPPSQGKRKPGGQPGHQGKTRKGFGRIDRYEMVRAQVCGYCGSQELSLVPRKTRRHEVAELIQPAIEVVEYEQQCCCCSRCGQETWGELPPQVLGGQSLGVGLQSLLVWLGNYAHMSYEKQQEFLEELGNITVGVGTLQATNERASQSVKPTVEELGNWVKHQDYAQVDETPWLVKGVKEWMWVVCGVGFCLFHAADTRSRAELETLLGRSFDGVLVSDDFSVYNGYEVKAQQKCLAHLRRHFKKVCKLRHGKNPELAKAFLDLIDTAFEQHRQWRETEDGAAYHQWAAGFIYEVKAAVEHWLPLAGHEAGLLLRSLRDKANQWWYFLSHPEIPPDNNRAERSLRLAVTKRKVCGGSRSMAGFAQTARLLSVIQTCRTQGRSVLSFLKQALMATASPEQVSMPSLIPAT